MKRIALVFAIVIALLFVNSSGAQAATLSWTAPTTYTDGSAIPGTKVINYTTFTGPAATGPWTTDSTVTATSDSMPEPLAGATLWYTVSAEVDGVSSGKAVAVSKSAPFRTPSAPSGLGIQ